MTTHAAPAAACTNQAAAGPTTLDLETTLNDDPQTDPTAALARVKAMHKPRTERHGSGCVQCGIVWPCPTYRELDDAVPVAAPPTEQAAEVAPYDLQVWPLARILAEVRCGSEDWTWDEEWADLDRRHVETGYLDRLEKEIKANGITMPVLIGTDGRLWDGHHRLRIAVRLGIGYVPVEVPAAGPVLPPPADRAAVSAPVKQRADCTQLEWAEQERARFERLYTRETVRADLAEQRAEQAEARAAAMERAMESTAADALKHRGCHRDLMAQCLRAERAEAEAARLRTELAEEIRKHNNTIAVAAGRTVDAEESRAETARLCAELRGVASHLQQRGADLNDGGLTAAADLLRRLAAETPQRSDVGTEFVHQADHPDTAGLDAVDADLAADEALRAKADEATATLRRIRSTIRTLKDQGATGRAYYQAITDDLAGPRPDRSEAAETPQPETQAAPAEQSWQIQTQWHDGDWRVWSVRDERDHAVAEFEHVKDGKHAWRLMRFDTTTAIEAEHAPAVVQADGEA